MSRRCKFMMVTWVGTQVSAMKRAKMSTDKALIKEVLNVRIHIFSFNTKITKNDKEKQK